MTLADLTDVIGQTGPAVFMCWYAMYLKRENMRLHAVIEAVQSDGQAGFEEPIPEPLPVARVIRGHEQRLPHRSLDR